MSIALVCTGTELLKGSTVNTNGAMLGRKLVSMGMAINFETVVGDREEDLYMALAASVRVADQIVICGGLGPTDDDISLPCVCRFFGMELEEDPVLHEKVKAFWARIHSGHCPRKQYRQAMVPVGGRYIPNPVGSASGIFFEADYAERRRRVYLLPGPPSEFVPMVDDHVACMLAEGEKWRVTTGGFLCAGTGESTVSALVEPVLAKIPVEIAYTAGFDGTRLYLSGKKTAVARGLKLAAAAVGDSALPPGETDLVDYVVKLLLKKKLAVGFAESCTGGMISSSLTDRPGVSAVFLGAVVSYSNDVKAKLLGVSRSTLARHGAVSEETALEMVSGVCRALGSDCGVAVTGIAGPDGGTDEKPVGLVYIAAKVRRKTMVEKYNFRGGRDTVRRRATAKAFLMLLRLLRNK